MNNKILGLITVALILAFTLACAAAPTILVMRAGGSEDEVVAAVLFGNVTGIAAIASVVWTGSTISRYTRKG